MNDLELEWEALVQEALTKASAEGTGQQLRDIMSGYAKFIRAISFMIRKLRKEQANGANVEEAWNALEMELAEFLAMLERKSAQME